MHAGAWAAQHTIHSVHPPCALLLDFAFNLWSPYLYIYRHVQVLTSCSKLMASKTVL